MFIYLKNHLRHFTIFFITSILLTLSIAPLIDAADIETTNSNSTRSSPIITSITQGITITWMQTGEIATSFDIIIDGVDTNIQYRTTTNSQTVDSGTCFIVQARYNDTLMNSDEVCFDPEPEADPEPTLTTARSPPTITSITQGITITWMQTGEIATSFDIIIDGVDTNIQYRTTSNSQTVDGGTCFIVQARYNDKLMNSDEVCFDPEPESVTTPTLCPPGKTLIDVFPFCITDPELPDPEPTLKEVDRFGTIHLYPTEGRIFESHWDEGGPRTLNGQDRDPIDAELVISGRNPQVSIDGAGIATMQGQYPGNAANPRMNVFDEAREKTWENTEITIYMMRISENQSLSYAGLNVNSRSEHQDSSEDPENGQSYGGRFTYFGKTQFVKEVVHDSVYQNADTKTYPWNTSNGQMPFNQWVGLKLVTYDLSNGDVKLELYMDLTDGLNGGDWKKVNEFIDDGTWEAPIFSEPATSIWIKNDGLGAAKYKNFSIREITPPHLSEV